MTDTELNSLIRSNLKDIGANVHMGEKVDIHTEYRYKIPKGTLIWLNMGQGLEIGMVSERTVQYDREDIISISPTKYKFKLPPHDRNAEWLEVRIEKVKCFPLFIASNIKD